MKLIIILSLLILLLAVNISSGRTLPAICSFDSNILCIDHKFDLDNKQFGIVIQNNLEDAIKILDAELKSESDASIDCTLDSSQDAIFSGERSTIYFNECKFDKILYLGFVRKVKLSVNLTYIINNSNKIKSIDGRIYTPVVREESGIFGTLNLSLLVAFIIVLALFFVLYKKIKK